MIYKADMNLRKTLFSMFENMEDTMILTCLQGHMGTAWVDDLINPTAAQLIVGDFIFYGGNPYVEASKELLCNLPKDSLVVGATDEWKERIEEIHKDSLEKFQRYAFKKDLAHLNQEYLQSLLPSLPEGYELKKVDSILAKESSFQELSPDFTGQFESIEDYIKRGLGFCILHLGKVVCGASCYSIYDKGIEIEIDTHPEHRRKGLATVAVAALILECLNRGLYPSYDAANLTSVKLAQKLGYVLDKPYDTYYIHFA